MIFEYKYFDETINILKKIVELCPELADAHLNLAKIYQKCWRIGEARQCLERALSLQPGYAGADNLLAGILVKQGRSEEALQLYLDMVNREGPLSRSVSSYLFSLLYNDKAPVEEKAEAHKAMMQRWVDVLYREPRFTQTHDPERTIRVGFISADFRDQHPVGIFVTPLFKYYKQHNLHFSAYYTSRTYDRSTAEIKALVDAWSDVADWSDERLRARIMEDQIDILVDLSGHTSKNRLQMFALRAAPVQLTWMAYPHSTGLATMDYLIADNVVCPAKNDHLCSETGIRLPGHCVFCLSPMDEFGEVDNDVPANRRQPVFGSFNNLSKVNESTLSLWIEVMQAVPDARLKLKTPSFTDITCRDEFKTYFEKAGINTNRLIFTGPSSLKDMMREYAELDIALDTLPYNGGTTTLQALWMGVPVITLEGENFCGRMGASILQHIGMDDWVAQNREQYVEIAVRMANNRKRLLAIKSQLREKMKASPLCDVDGFAEAMCDVFHQVWQSYCETQHRKPGVVRMC